VGSVGAGGITATSIADNAIDAAALASDVVTELQSGLATAAALTTIDNFLDTEIAAILEDTTLIEKWIIDKMVATDNGDGTITYVLYDTDGTTPLKTWVETTATGTRAAAT
jgi:hypothetical protein